MTRTHRTRPAAPAPRPVTPVEEVAEQKFGRPASGLRARMYAIIFESDTRAGRLFDQLLIVAIVASLMVVVADSVQSVRARVGPALNVIEWGFTLLFTVEYLSRLLCVRRPLAYARSFFGIVDLLAILPTWAALMFPELSVLLDVRVLRLLRVFRVFKLTGLFGEYRMLGDALRASSRKIGVFLSVVLMLVLVLGTVMHVVEGPANGFTSIPVSVYWAITTVTTVGFGDITPRTDLGRMIASLTMLLGWGVLAVPTGIVTAEMTAQRHRLMALLHAPCPACGHEGAEPDARFCSQCGESLAPASSRAPPAG